MRKMIDGTNGWKHWTRPRAYLVHMSSRDLRALVAMEQARAEAIFADYVAQLAEKGRHDGRDG